MFVCPAPVNREFLCAQTRLRYSEASRWLWFIIIVGFRAYSVQCDGLRLDSVQLDRSCLCVFAVMR